MTISVILPTYNREGTIRRSIKSAISQTVEDIEIIIVDDASTDDTKSIVSEFDDDRLEYIKHKSNKGGSAARNTGLEYATGEYVAFLDSDDEWVEHKLEKQISVLKQSPERYIAAYCDVVYASGKFENAVGSILDVVIPRPDIPKKGGEELIKYVLLRQFNLGCSSTLVVERSIAESIGGFDESFKRHQDLEFLIRVLGNGDIEYVDEQLVHKYSTGHPRPETTIEAKKKYFNKFSHHLDDCDISKEKVTKVHNYQIACQYLETGQLRNGITMMSKSKASSKREYIRGLLALQQSIRGTVRN